MVASPPTVLLLSVVAGEIGVIPAAAASCAILASTMVVSPLFAIQRLAGAIESDP